MRLLLSFLGTFLTTKWSYRLQSDRYDPVTRQRNKIESYFLLYNSGREAYGIHHATNRQTQPWEFPSDFYQPSTDWWVCEFVRNNETKWAARSDVMYNLHIGEEMGCSTVNIELSPTVDRRLYTGMLRCLQPRKMKPMVQYWANVADSETNIEPALNQHWFIDSSCGAWAIIHGASYLCIQYA